MKNLSIRLFHLIWIFVLSLGFITGLIACADATVKTGPYIEVLNFEAGLVVNSQGQVVLESDYKFPIIGIQKIGAIGWSVGFEKVLYEAKTKRYRLILVWEDQDSSIWTTEYDIRQPFSVQFREDDWVRKIQGTGDSNIAVMIERRKVQGEQQALERVPKQQAPVTVVVVTPIPPKNEPTPSCPGAPRSRLAIGMPAYICTQVDRVIVRVKPAPGSTELVRLNPGQSVTIVNGPKCDPHKGWYYWKIRTEYGTEGWASEGGDQTDPYWICPK